jgi:hypothetical protein
MTVVAATTARPRPKRITRENVERVMDLACTEGADRRGVEAILGPAGDFSTGPLTLADDSGWRSLYEPIKETPNFAGSSVVSWTDDELSVLIIFEKGRPVAFVTPLPVERAEQGLLDNLLWRGKRQWNRWFPKS